MKGGWYILVLRQIGNVGAHEIFRIEEQPEDGFFTEKEAYKYLEEHIEEYNRLYMFSCFMISKLFFKN